MYGTLAAYTTNAVIKQAKAILTGYASRLGAPLAVSVVRENGMQPATAALPAVWVQGLAPDELVPNVLGDVIGVAADGTSVTRGLLFDEDMPLRANFGARARQAAERDDIFDFLALSFLLALDPTSQLPWKQEMWSAYGLQPLGIGKPAYGEQTISGMGEVFEVQAQIAFAGQLAVTVLTTPISAITVGPLIDAGASVFLGS